MSDQPTTLPPDRVMVRIAVGTGDGYAAEPGDAIEARDPRLVELAVAAQPATPPADPTPPVAPIAAPHTED